MMDGINLQHTFILLIVTGYVVEAAKILFMSMALEKSHALSMMPLAEKLSVDGHNVSLFHDAAKYTQVSKLVPNICPHDDSLKQGHDEFMEKLGPIIWNGQYRDINNILPWEVHVHKFLPRIKLEYIETIINADWDLIFVDSIFQPIGMFMAAKGYNLVQMHTSKIYYDYANGYGMERALSTSTPLFLRHSDGSHNIALFSDRLYRTEQYFEGLIAWHGFIARWMRTQFSEIGIESWSWQHHYDSTIYSFFDYPYTIGFIESMTHGALAVSAPCTAIPEMNPLPVELANFVNDPSSNGTIYIAFGSIVRWDSAPQYTIEAFLGTFRSMSDYRFVWSYRGPKLNTPSTVFVHDWLPQKDILVHPKTKLFIGHGGMKSVKEAICSGRPLVVMPMFAEQVMNSWMLRRQGIAGYINKFDVTADTLETKIRQIINDDWDLVFVDSNFQPIGIYMGAKGYNIVQMHTSVILYEYANAHGMERVISTSTPKYMSHANGTHYATYFWDRLYRTEQYIEGWITWNIIIERWIRNQFSEFGVDNWSWQKHYDNSVYSFVDYPYTIGVVESMTHGALNVAVPCAEIKKMNPLPEDLADFLDDPSSKGTIVIAFGSIIKWDSAPKYAIDAFLGTFRSMKDYRFVWSYCGPKLNTPTNVYVHDWLPQKDILVHPKTKLFIGHGGMKSVKEAVCSDVPSIVMPMFADQVFNSWMLRRQGIAGYINKFTINAESLEASIRQIIEDPSSTELTRHRRKLWSDEVMPVLDVASHTVNRIIKYKKKLLYWFRPTGVRLPIYQRFHLDLATVIFPTALTILLLSK